MFWDSFQSDTDEELSDATMIAYIVSVGESVTEITWFNLQLKCH